MTFFHPCPEPELKYGSGLDIRATVTPLTNPQVTTEITLSTDSMGLTASIATIIGLVVV